MAFGIGFEACLQILYGSFTVETTAGTQQVERKSILAIGYVAGLGMRPNDEFQGGRRVRGCVVHRKIAMKGYSYDLCEKISKVQTRSDNPATTPIKMISVRVA
jgi:hypothetical protein